MNLLQKLKDLDKLVLVLMLIGLTSCVHDYKRNANSLNPLNIYQPSTLILPPNVTIPTEEGSYTTQLREVWHSDARYRRLERELYSK